MLGKTEEVLWKYVNKKFGSTSTKSKENENTRSLIIYWQKQKLYVDQTKYNHKFVKYICDDG